MLKKIIVGILVSTVVVAVGASIYNARASTITAASVDESTLEAPAEPSAMQAGGLEVGAGTVEAGQDTPPVADQDITAPLAGQSQGYWAGERSGTGIPQGGGRRQGQGMQTGVAANAYAGDTSSNSSTNSLSQGLNQQGSGSASGRPEWAGGNGRGQGAGGRNGRP